MNDRQALGNHGQKYGFDWRGRRYYLSFITQKVKTAFHGVLYDAAFAEAERVRQRAGDEAFFRLVERIGEQAGKGEFDWGGKRHQEITGTAFGTLCVLKALLGDQIDGMSGDDLERMVIDKQAEIKALIEQIAADSGLAKKPGKPEPALGGPAG